MNIDSLWEPFTPSAQQERAFSEARRLGNNVVAPLHIVLAFLDPNSPLQLPLRYDIQTEAVVTALELNHTRFSPV